MQQPVRRPQQPWDALLTAVNDSLTEPVDLYCLGGFVMAEVYGMARATADIDFLEVLPANQASRIIAVAGPGSTLAEKLGVYLNQTAVQTVPEDYRSRAVEMFPGAYGRLRLWALDPYDLALSKLERNVQKDRDDVKYLATHAGLDSGLLRQRYQTELRPYLGTAEREDLTLDLWVEMISDTS